MAMICDHVGTNLSIEMDDSEFAPNQEGELGKVHRLFGNEPNGSPAEFEAMTAVA